MDGVVPHEASAIHPDAREEQFKETLSFHAQRVKDSRRAGRAGWFAGVIGMTAGMAGCVAVVMMLPLKQTVVRFVEVDRSTGWSGDAIEAHDAPKIFNERVGRHDVRTYIESREGYNPTTDQREWQTVKAMSSENAFNEYTAWRKSDVSPLKILKTNGHVDIDNFSWDKAYKMPDGTWSYVAHFDMRMVNDQAVGPWKSKTATVAFQWHPEMHRSELDSELNPTGFQVLSYERPGE